MRDGGSGEEPAFEALVQQLCSQQTKPISPCFNQQTSGPGCSTTSFSEHTTFDFFKLKIRFSPEEECLQGILLQSPRACNRHVWLSSGLALWNSYPQLWKPWEATAQKGNVSCQGESKNIRSVRVFFVFFLLWLFLSHDSGTGTKRKLTKRRVTSDLGTH